ncbi:MAG: tetratricopeptide repeat protein [Flavobacteriaceae bacterium]|nr:tetratricopeptide repeat protein [Flavobacteriaceae bacterium]MDG2314634.1 tetratricopeptide repeat protein [Flavobacteriaceae bacterium]
MKKEILFVIAVFCFGHVFGQQPSQKKQSDNFLYQGNQELSKKEYIQAETSYRKSLSLTPDNPTATYNLGNSLYENNHNAEAFYQFKATAQKSTTKEEKHRAFHNMGNVFMKTQEYDKAVESYKNALRNNPNDDQTRYNYALAKELLKKQQDEQKNQDQNKDDKDSKDDKKKDENKEGDQDSKDQEKDNKEGEDQEDKEKSDDSEDKQKEKDTSKEEKPEEEESQKSPPPATQMSPQQLKNLLEAMTNEEKNVQEKVNAQKAKGVPVKAKKDW